MAFGICRFYVKKPLVKDLGLLTALVLVFSCSTKPHAVQGRGEFQGGGDNAVYILHHGWHTGVVVPAESLQTQLPALTERFTDAHYIEFGWGDKEFYQAAEMNSGLGMRAIFWPTDTVVRAVALPENTAPYFSTPGVVKLCANNAQLTALVDYLANSFARDQGEIIATGNGSVRRSQFYVGVGDYFLTNTCNTWTAKALKSLGMDVSTSFKASSTSVMDYLYDHAGAETLRLLEGAARKPTADALACQ